ncbi:MAG: hypothetical protein FJ224_04700 [Lentisphaerae bacterium]|nr:hypothetical protein [Lentisphaerota bacterium]
MTKAFRVDDGFVPCPVNAGDELFPNGVFEFNITKMLEHISRNPTDVACVEVAVDDLDEVVSPLDDLYVESADISRPLVLAEISPGRFNLIDGHHRLVKARRSGVSTLHAHKLTAAQHLPFLTSKKAYLAYVEYWNGKVKGSRQQCRAESGPRD